MRAMANTSTPSLLGHQYNTLNSRGVDPPVSSLPAAGAGVSSASIIPVIRSSSVNNDISSPRSCPPDLQSSAVVAKSADPPFSPPSTNVGADSSTDSTSPLSDITAHHGVIAATNTAQGRLDPEHKGCTIRTRGYDPPTVSSPLAKARSGCNSSDSTPLSDYTQM